MRPISEDDIKDRLARDNPWWRNASSTIPEQTAPRRVYFASFKALALEFDVRRAVVLLGPRRVGKTFMIKQLIAEAIEAGIGPMNIMYVSVDTPMYFGLSLQHFVDLLPSVREGPPVNRLVVFDEIQYLRHWEVHLKDLVDNHPKTKFVATGSAAAALRLKSPESGAGRFSDFMLPPLTFYEFLAFIEKDKELITATSRFDAVLKREQYEYEVSDLDELNSRFLDYLNYGGYPEAVLNERVRENPEQFIRNDIIDKVLLKDLPSLYGIDDIQELNRLFSFLAYNAGNEASLENISQESGISKPTIKRYIEYLESAFLIIKLSNVDDNCRTMKRERNFKVYLNNPSMRAALFAPVQASDPEQVGHLAECAIFSQWQHSNSFRNLRYSRWRDGEVDIVYLFGPRQLPAWVGEIKWSDRVARSRWSELKSIQTLLRKHSSIKTVLFTSRTTKDSFEIDGRLCRVWPSALYCYAVGRNITSRLAPPISPGVDDAMVKTA